MHAGGQGFEPLILHQDSGPEKKLENRITCIKQTQKKNEIEIKTDAFLDLDGVAARLKASKFH